MNPARPQPLSEDEIDRIARRRAGAKLGWYVHAAVYVCVNIAMFALSQVMEHRRWSVYPVVGWGAGLAFHGLSVFVLGTDGSLRERMVERERQRLLRQRDGV